MLLILFITSVFADTLFGPEFTFTHPTLIAGGRKEGINEDISKENTFAMEYFAYKMRKKCAKRILDPLRGCKVEVDKNRWGDKVYKVVYRDGHHFTIARDPMVLEVQMKPVTVSRAKYLKSRMQSDIFDTARELNIPKRIPNNFNEETFRKLEYSTKNGLVPSPSLGGGHIHMDLYSSLGDSSIKLRNFIVDFFNHPTLMLYPFGRSPNNAPPLALLSDRQKRAFIKVIENFDNSKPRWSQKKLARTIIREVYYKTLNKPGKEGAWTPPSKYQSLNLSRVLFTNPSARTLEMRGFRAQRSMEEFIKEIDLLQRKARSTPDNVLIPINFQDVNLSEVLRIKRPFVKRCKKELSSYLQGTNLDLEDFGSLLPRMMR